MKSGFLLLIGGFAIVYFSGCLGVALLGLGVMAIGIFILRLVLGNEIWI